MPSAALPISKPLALPRTNLVRLTATALVLVGLVRLADTLPGAWQRNDFAHYYLSAQVMLTGEDPYTASLQPHCERLGFEYDQRIVAGTNPPLLTQAITGVAWLPPRPAYAAWTFVQIGCLFWLLRLLARGAPLGSSSAWQWLAVGVVLNSTAVWSHLHYSQVQLLLAALIAAAYFLKQQGRGCLAVALLSLATGLKLYPAVLLPWFVLAGANGWRNAARRAATMTAVGLTILAATGIQPWLAFVTHGLGTIQNSVYGSTSNYSIHSALVLLTGALAGRPVPAELLAYVEIAARCLAALAIAAAYLVIWRRRMPDHRAIGLLTVAMILASPVCWSHYLVLLILPVWLWWSELSTRTTSPQTALFAILGGLCLVSELDAWVPLGTMGLARTALHFYPVAALLLFALVLTVFPRDVARIEAAQ